MRKRTNRRRGALLLVVLSILVLFLIIAVTFVVVARNFNSASITAARTELTGSDPAKTLDKAFEWIAVGPRPDFDTAPDLKEAELRLAAGRPPGFESIFEDMYGWHWVRGNIVNPPTAGLGGQIFEVDVLASTPYSFRPISYTFTTAPPNGTPNQTDVQRMARELEVAFYNGGVLTILSGVDRGVSCRIIRATISPPADPSRWEEPNSFQRARFVCQSPKNDAAWVLNATGTPRVVINGRPFSGYARYSDGKVINENYDAFDNRNPFLTEMVPRVTVDANGRETVRMDTVREALKDPNIPGASLLTVDNDGDNEPDSRFIDPGFGIKCVQGPQGAIPKDQRTYYKELIAPLVLDLDSRVNLNADGNTEQVKDLYYNPWERKGQGYGPADVNPYYLYLEALRQNAGEAKLEYSYLYDGYPAGANYPKYPGRYGYDDSPGIANEDDVFSAIRNPGLPLARFLDAPSGYGTPPDLWGIGQLENVNAAGHPIWSNLMLTGNQAVDDPYEFDPFAGGPAPLPPRFPATSQDIRDEVQRYYDRPLTPGELEAVLRYYDNDRQILPQRMLELCRRMLDDAKWGNELMPKDVALNRHRVTTVSSHVPCIDVPMLNQAWRANHKAFLAAYEYSLNQREPFLPHEIMRGLKMDLNRPFGDGLDNNGNGVIDESEVFAPSGNVLPNTESDQAWPPATATGQALPGNFQAAKFYHFDVDTPAQNKSLYGRQLYARQLYCLMLSLMRHDDGGTGDLIHNEPNNVGSPLTHRRIAQWAINVVDFYDSDCIMTPFYYDPECCQYDASTDTYSWKWEAPYGNPATPVVWGCEYPHLLLTEAVAYHDKRLRDAKVDSKGGDNARLKIKEGAGTTNVGHPAGSPGTLQAGGGSTPREYEENDLDLDQYGVPEGSLFLELYCTGATSATNPQLPRELYPTGDRLQLSKMTPDGNNPVWRIAITRARDRHTGTGPTGNKSYAERLDVANATPNDLDTTDFDRPLTAATTIDRVIWLTTETTQRSIPVTSEDGYPIYYDRSGNPEVYLDPDKYVKVGPRPSTKIANQTISLNTATDIIAAADGCAWATEGVGVSASEPLPSAYYPDPQDPAPNRKIYMDGSGNSLPRDTPLDSDRSGLAGVLGKEDTELLVSGTHLDYKTALLQRLANPLANFNSVTNPYITVDWIPIDLTVFNGDDNGDEHLVYGDPNAAPTATFEQVKDPAFVSDVFDSTVDPDLPFDMDDEWGPFGANAPGGTGQAELDLRTARVSRERGYYDSSSGTANLWSSRALPDDEMDPLPAGGDSHFPFDLKHTLGVEKTDLVGKNQPWMAWNDRPFASAMELMLVPWSSPGRLLFEFQLGSDDAQDFYDEGNSNGANWLSRPFAHLPNFYTDDTGDYYQIFDFVDVPSRFVGTETIINPDHAQTRAVINSNVAGFFRPPFNKLSNFREPGRVNVNLISDYYLDQGSGGGSDTSGAYSAIWQAVSRLPKDEARAMWDEVLQSRQPSAGAAQPFRGFSTGIDDSWLRPQQGSSNRHKLFETYPTQDYPNQRVRNAFLEVDGLQRIYNVLTPRSNVYAIWLTVGYFECNANGVLKKDATNGQPIELGADTGNITRHRAFYIVDRSIPVGFEPGERHNIDRAVLIKRIIE